MAPENGQQMDGGLVKVFLLRSAGKKVSQSKKKCHKKDKNIPLGGEEKIVKLYIYIV